jgi:hypothetical protein
MIHYQLRCEAGHGFDGWFRDSLAFEQQAAGGLLECPHCGETKVERALMTPHVPRKGRALVAPVEAAPVPVPAEPLVPEPSTAVAVPMPDKVRAALQRLRAEVEKNCDYVGEQFADEARKIHNGESDRRGIYGETTPEQAEALADEGIEIARVPWIKRADG